MRKTLILSLLGVAILTVGCQDKKKKVSVDCPKEDKIVEVIKKFSSDADITIEKVQQLDNLNLCEVQFRLGIRPAIFYVNEDLSLLFPSVIDRATGENLAVKSINERNKIIPQKILKKFDDYVTFTEGKGDKFVYFITDANCEECKKAYETLKSWADKNNVKIKIIIRPMDQHPNSYRIAAAVLCDKKSFNDLLNNYDSKNTCEEGIKKLNDTLKFIDEKMVMFNMNNPIIISEKGKFLTKSEITEQDLKWLME
ncbi:MAG: hypothetical protein ACP5F0_07395 [Sulfurihydrogenibium sp.]